MELAADDLDLPEAEFSYIGRPWETFTGRWAAIRKALLEELPCSSPQDRASASCGPTVVDLGSNNGYFSMQTAHLLPSSNVIGVEGAVGVGNGTMGTRTSKWRSLCGTTAIQTHLRWVQKLKQANCLLAPEVWDFDHITSLAKRGMCVDVMLSLSVVHHIDEYSAPCYARQPELAGQENKVEAFLQLMRRLLELANVHLVELPDAPWIGHVHNAFENSAQRILEAACQRTSFQWDMRKIYSSTKWIGKREVWLLRRQPASEVNEKSGSLPSLRRFFEVLLPPPAGEEMDQEVAELLADARASKPLMPIASSDKADLAGGSTVVEMGQALPIVGAASFVQDILLGTWTNSQGRRVSLFRDKEEAPEPQSLSRFQCWASYQKDAMDGGGEVFPISWQPEDSSWRLSNHMGHFALTRASVSHLCWEATSDRPWSTTWIRCSD